MSFLDLCRNLHIPYETEESPKVQVGWVGLTCPFCRSHGPHLGVHLEGWGTNCWRCGSHPLDETLVRITGLSRPEVWNLIREYRGKKTTKRRIVNKESKINIRRFQFPPGCGEMDGSHRVYLEKRGFDPDHIAKEWDVKGTGPSSFLDHINYSYRIVAPIVWDGEIVSFQSRDITGKSQVKYLACPPGRESKSHKDVLYGQQGKWGEVGVCVEGITDCWRLGPKSFATFGVQLRTTQLLLMTQQFRKLVILFDSEPPAQKRAKHLASRLRGAGVRVQIETVDTDPADLDEKEARCLVRKLVSTSITIKGGVE